MMISSDQVSNTRFVHDHDCYVETTVTLTIHAVALVTGSAHAAERLVCWHAVRVLVTRLRGVETRISACR